MNICLASRFASTCQRPSNSYCSHRIQAVPSLHQWKSTRNPLPIESLFWNQGTQKRFCFFFFLRICFTQTFLVGIGSRRRIFLFQCQLHRILINHSQSSLMIPIIQWQQMPLMNPPLLRQLQRRSRHEHIHHGNLAMMILGFFQRRTAQPLLLLHLKCPREEVRRFKIKVYVNMRILAEETG